jgi:hypothetical protein
VFALSRITAESIRGALAQHRASLSAMPFFSDDVFAFLLQEVTIKGIHSPGVRLYHI